VELYLIRHAGAVDADAGMTDAERPLSDEGYEKMRKGAKGLRNLLSGSFPPLDVVLTSPLRRAVESAKIIAGEVNDNDEIVECSPLAEEEVKWEDLLPFLIRYPKTGRVAIVGHEPSLGKLAGWLLTRTGELAIPMKKGSAMCLEFEEPVPDPKAELHWFLTPKQMRQLR
jgi:phosphohistidine phosphatase